MLKLKQTTSKTLSFQMRGTLLFVACSLSGCSTLQSWFPDKEKDYQFTTELPPLVIPADLAQKPSVPLRSAPTEPMIAKTIEPVKSQAKNVTPVIEAIPESKSVNHPVLTDAETELSRNEIQVSLTHENTPTLNLNVPAVRAWRIVGKALSRSGIEVTNRNQENGQIHVQFSESKSKAEPEKSLWDNTVSVFNPFAENEQSYILKFNETNSKTAVTVLDTDLQPFANDKLLTILFEAIKADLSK